MVFNSSINALAARHIQGSEGVEYTIDYWGYAVRNFPCTNDAGSCEYLDSIYGDHYTSMIYTFILWAVFGAILLIILLSRLVWPSKDNGDGARSSVAYRLMRLTLSTSRRYLVPECTKMFRYTTRLQVLVLVILCAYLIAFSFTGITYKTWVTPVKGTDLKNIRCGIGGFADRLGAFAFALTPLTIALCSRDSILSLLTGIPYQSFNFLHRWTGRIILVQSFIHAIIWTVVEGRLYQPQPTVYVEWIKQKYMIWGIVAQSFVTFLFVFSLRPVIRWTGYEFFRKSHLVVAGLYIGACWGHWEKLSCWMIASLAIIGFDFAARTARTCFMHCGYKEGGRGFGFRSVSASLENFRDPTGTVVRMTFSHDHKPWEIGQHFYLTFPALNIWQSHPFTPVSHPTATSPMQRHTYIIRACNGETKKLAALAESAANRYPLGDVITPVILQGPYGGSITNKEVSNVLAISGGTGITYTLPVVMAALADTSNVRNVELVWTVRHLDNLAWIGSELAYLKSRLDHTPTPTSYGHSEDKAEKFPILSTGPKKRFRIKIFVTRLDASAFSLRQKLHEQSDAKDEDFGLDNSLSPVSSYSTSCSTAISHKLEDLVREHPNFSITLLANSRTNVASLVDSFMNDTVEKGRTQVIGSGPPELGTQLREAVAAQNSPCRVWQGDDNGDVECVWDDRLG